MDNFESEFNIIHKIIENNETYTKLIIMPHHCNHYAAFMTQYCSTYRNNDFEQMLTNALYNNTFINEIYTDVYFSTNNGWRGVKQIIHAKIWKSIYIGGYSSMVLDTLLTQQNPNLTKLKLSQICKNGDNLLKVTRNTSTLENFELSLSGSTNEDLPNISQAVYESNIKTLTIHDICETHINLKFIDNIIKCKTRNLHLKNLYHLIEFDMTNNYNILNFTIDDISPNYIQNILNRNKKYIFTVLLCMNKKIIPRCVFKNLILKSLFIM